MTCFRGCVIAVALGAGLWIAGCGGDDDSSGPPTPETDGGFILRCSTEDDPDHDYISSMDEGEGDPDLDGRPNLSDDDSDGDGWLDLEEAGDRDCSTVPVDTDLDAVPDFLDLDANGDGVRDADQRGTDLDMDGVPDALDGDVDGDGIVNTIEYGPPGPAPVDTDGDGTPDVRDLDSDADNILDRHEGNIDPDADHIPNFRDTDSDGDEINDATEAGDGDLMTPPFACSAEIDPVTEEVRGDGYPDFSDADSDNDGLSDGEERAIGTDLCNIDTDGDGVSDLAEGAYQRINCPDGTSGIDCGCATNDTCHIPSSHFYVVLPYLGDPQQRDLSFGTTIRVADVFFITDTTGSMGGTVDNVKRTVTTPGTGLIDRIRDTIPDVWFGGGQHDDFPFAGWGSPPDQPFILAIAMTPPSMAAAVQAAFDSIMIHNGADGPESQTEGLYQLITGEGGTWMYGGGSYTMRHYEGDCIEGGWGAACFRAAALPIVVHFTDICSHNGPPGEDSGCDPYSGLTPPAHTWEQMIAALNRRGAKYIGINAGGFFDGDGSGSCAAVIGPSGWSPCFFMKRTAEETGSIDLDGNALVYDLPNSGTDPLVFSETIASAIETVATRVPLDVDTGLRDDHSDAPDDIDATHFIKMRQPACMATPPTDPCWTEPPGTSHADAVAFVDTSTFFSVIPGTTVLFRITFQNDFYQGARTARVFVAYIDVRGGGSAILDTRQVYIIVPASSVIFG